jgi:hypothetical protein
MLRDLHGLIMSILLFFRLCVIVGPLPITLTNGTVADATQVMTDLQFIADQVNANASGGGSSSGGARNFLYNAAMRFAQRIGSAAQNVTAGSAYCLDRWEANAGVGMSVDVSQITGIGLAGFQYAMRLQRTAGNAAVTLIQFAQSLETVDSIPMQGATVTLSFYARNGANFSPINAAVAASIVTGTGTDENVLPGYTGEAVSQKTYAISSTWTRYQLTATIAAGTTEVGVVFTETPTGTAGAADYFDVTGIQLEIAAAAGAFEVIPYTTDLQRVQRYYQKSFEVGTAPITNSTGNCAIFNSMVVKAGASFFFCSFTLPVRMRDQLTTGVIYNPQVANNQIRDTIANADFTGSAISAIGMSATALGTGPAGAAVGDQVWFNWSLDGEL